LLLINSDGITNKYAMTNFVLVAKEESRIIDVEVAMYNGHKDWNMESPPFSSFIPLTCVSALKTVDTSKPGLIRVTGPVFEIVQ
jgi:hypothetical protein